MNKQIIFISMFSNLAFFEIEAWGDSEMAFLFKSGCL